MKEVYRRCCGMDVHQKTVVVCVLPPVGNEGKLIRKVYGTFRNELIRMRVWLKQLKVTEIAMESTGVYWRPIWNVLEEQGFGRLLLVNPVQVKALQGRKSDGRDCQPMGSATRHHQTARRIRARADKTSGVVEAMHQYHDETSGAPAVTMAALTTVGLGCRWRWDS